ncbi:MAG: amino acid adenylation domain-containing protein [Bacillota bacterium]|jgi:pyochelin synthetase
MILNSKINVKNLVARLNQTGITLWEEDGKLRYRAPQGMLTVSELQTLKECKADILKLLQVEAKPAPVESHPESRYEPFGLTDVQTAYLLGRSEVFGYGGVACHIYLELNYPELQRDRTEAVWRELVKRHDMLRAAINREGYQQVRENVPYLEVAYVDATSWKNHEVTAKLETIRAKMGHRIYNTDCWPLFGVAVTQTSDRAVFHFSIEFLIADWASIWLLLAEFETLYFEPERRLPELKLSFRDYFLAERNLRESVAYSRDKDYWLRRIDDLPSAPDLPLARLQNNPGPSHFTRRFLRMDAITWEGLKQKAQQRGLTPTVAVLTAYAAVIERWSRSQKFCLNLTVLNRLPLHPQINAIVGDFTSVSLLAVDWQGGNSFSNRAKLMNQQLFADLDHRLFSGVEVLREISRRRGRDAALMPIVFTSAIGLLQSVEGKQLRGKVGDQGISQTPQVFLDCQAMDNLSGLQVNWDIREGVFPEGLIDEMFVAFKSLLWGLAGAEQTWDAVETISLPEWQQRERQRINDTGAPLSDEMLHSAILQQAVAAPDRLAVCDAKKQLTYKELVAQAAAVAAQLRKTGCRKQDRVAIIMDKSVYQVIAVLGTLAMGAVYVPIDTIQPALRREAMLEKTQVRYILTCSWIPIKWPENVTVIATDLLEPDPENTWDAAGDPDLPAYIIHTSGSTGQPKGAVITHRAAVNTIKAINSRFNIGRGDRVLGLAQLSFDLSVYDIFGILSAGGTLVYPSAARAADPSHWAELLVKQQITVWNSVPALLQMLVAYLDAAPEIKLPQLRLALLSGDWIPLSLPDLLLKRAPAVRVVGLGGATEASIWSIFHEYQGLQPDWNSIPYGRPLTNQGFRVLDEQMRDCPVWVTGELYISGAGLAVGYFADQETTRARFVTHPLDGQRLYRTGDLGRYTPGGEIEFLGREDHQVKIKGHRIELGEIEATLQKHPAVAAAAVVVHQTGEVRLLVGFVVTAGNEEAAVSVPELTDFLAQRLPAYMIPATLQTVKALPLTGNGKIDRKALDKWRVESFAEEDVAATAAQITDSLEAQLAKIWADALGLPCIGRLQNFYDHGADSLIMAQVAGKLREMVAGKPFLIDIPFDIVLRQMLNYPTVAALAQFVRSQGSRAGEVAGASLSEKTSKSNSNAVLTSYGGGDAGPLRVVFHAGLGTMNCFRLLLDHLNEQNSGPVVGITIADSDLYCSGDHVGLIERLADDYAERLLETGYQKMQLIGYCLGGMIAVEVARRLLENGARVADLVLIDSHPVLYEIDDDLVIEALFVPNLNISLEQAGFSGINQPDLARGLWRILNANQKSVSVGSSLTIGGDAGLDRVGKLFGKLAAFSVRERFTAYVAAVFKYNGNHMPVEMAEGLFKVYRQSLKSARFTPRPYLGDLRFLLAREPFALLPDSNKKTLDFWREVCLGEVTVSEIAGNHFTCIETEPNAGDLAKVINEVLVKD